jgi:tetratricopeptide (TPR) repeat protein
VSFNDVALILQQMGRTADAEPLHRRALAIREKALGPEHPNVAASLNNLAELHQTQGRYAEAEPLFRRSLVIREKALGAEHLDLATSLNNLALLYRAQGRYAEAEPLYRRAYRILLNAGEPRLAWTIQGNLCTFYAKSLPDLAIFYGKQAVNTLQSVRNHLKTTDVTTQKAFVAPSRRPTIISSAC